MLAVPGAPEHVRPHDHTVATAQWDADECIGPLERGPYLWDGYSWLHSARFFGLGQLGQPADRSPGQYDTIFGGDGRRKLSCRRRGVERIGQRGNGRSRLGCYRPRLERLWPIDRHIAEHEHHSSGDCGRVARSPGRSRSDGSDADTQTDGANCSSRVCLGRRNDQNRNSNTDPSGFGDACGNGDGDRDASGDGDRDASGYGDRDASGYGDGYGDRDASGYGDGDRDASGYGGDRDASGYEGPGRQWVRGPGRQRVHGGYGDAGGYGYRYGDRDAR